MKLEFSGEVWFWRGPAPWYFVTVPPEQFEDLQAASSLVTYGWGMIPVYACVGKTTWQTSLFPKNGSYIVPLKTTVRQAENIAEGSRITVSLELRL